VSRGMEIFYHWLKWRAGDDHVCHWGRAKMAKDPRLLRDLDVEEITLRTINAWVSKLEKAGAISVARRHHQTCIITIKPDRQMTLDFSVENAPPSPVASPVNSPVASPVKAGHQITRARALESLEYPESLEEGIDDDSGSIATTITEPQQQRRRQPAPEGPKTMPEPEAINALQLSISDEEYEEFCNQCARERLSIPSEEDAARVKRKFVGHWSGRPAWLQLRAFPGQKTVGLWLSLRRRQVLMEMQRQALTPPELTKSQQSMANATRRFLEGS
jgi:hypothetical protein